MRRSRGTTCGRMLAKALQGMSMAPQGSLTKENGVATGAFNCYRSIFRIANRHLIKQQVVLDLLASTPEHA